MIEFLFPDVETTLSSIGLILDIIGVILLFKFGLPENLSREGYDVMRFVGINEDEKRKAKLYDRWAKVALMLLVFGFALQLISKYF